MASSPQFTDNLDSLRRAQAAAVAPPDIRSSSIATPERHESRRVGLNERVGSHTANHVDASWMLPRCFLDASSQMLPRCPLDASWMPAGCFPDAHWMPAGCFPDAPWMPLGCSLDAPWMLLDSFSEAPWMSVGCFSVAFQKPCGCLLNAFLMGKRC